MVVARSTVQLANRELDDFVAPTSDRQVARPAQDSAPTGLTSEEARARLEKDGPNAMPDTSAHPLRDALAKFWAPVPWLLEASIVLETVLHKYYEAGVIAALLVFNAALAYFQESRALATLTALKSRLALNASVERDGKWKTIPAAELVCGDQVKLSLGGVVAADVHLTGGSVELDQSMLTGESLPIDAGSGTDTFAGLWCGEARPPYRNGYGDPHQVWPHGGTRSIRTRSEYTADGRPQDHSQPGGLQLPNHRCNGRLCVLPCDALNRDDSAFADIGPRHHPSRIAGDIYPRCRDWRSCSRQAGVLPTRLSAVDEAASIDVLCSDKPEL